MVVFTVTGDLGDIRPFQADSKILAIVDSLIMLGLPLQERKLLGVKLDVSGGDTVRTSVRCPAVAEIANSGLKSTVDIGLGSYEPAYGPSRAVRAHDVPRRLWEDCRLYQGYIAKVALIYSPRHLAGAPTGTRLPVGHGGFVAEGQNAAPRCWTNALCRALDDQPCHQ